MGRDIHFKLGPIHQLTNVHYRACHSVRPNKLGNLNMGLAFQNFNVNVNSNTHLKILFLFLSSIHRSNTTSFLTSTQNFNKFLLETKCSFLASAPKLVSISWSCWFSYGLFSVLFSSQGHTLLLCLELQSYIHYLLSQGHFHGHMEAIYIYIPISLCFSLGTYVLSSIWRQYTEFVINWFMRRC